MILFETLIFILICIAAVAFALFCMVFGGDFDLVIDEKFGHEVKVKHAYVVWGGFLVLAILMAGVMV